MQYTMTKPCDACPFLRGSGFTWKSLEEHASGEFACHKTCDVSEDDENAGTYEPNDDSLHCAGALIFLEKQNRPHQMMRIAERLGLYDRRKLDMSADVVNKRSECRRGSRG